MKVYNSLEEWKNSPESGRRTAVALGNFDGVHLGHRKLIERCVSTARQRGELSLCFTFSNHPRNLFCDMKDDEDDNDELLVRFISSTEEKLAYMEKLGVDCVLDVPFDKTMMETESEDFVRCILKDTLNASVVCCGFNYRFGRHASGDSDKLIEEGKKYGIEVCVQGAVTVDGEIVSSTAIRRAIESGKIDKANKMLGHPYSVTGKVVEGNRIGRRIGSPTANVMLEASRIVPPNGVYFTKTTVGEGTYGSVSNVGVKPTIGNYAKSIETNIFDFSGDIYGQEITIDFYVWERSEKKFADTKELAVQIKKDAAMARDWYETEGKK